MHKEDPLPFQEFSGVNFSRQEEAELAERLVSPTRKVGKWYQKVVTPPVWYKGAFKGSLANPQEVATFQKEYNQRSIINPTLKDPYTYIDSMWRARSIAFLPGVVGILNSISRDLRSTAMWVRQSSLNRTYSQFADYLELTAQSLPEGNFDASMKAFVELPSTQRVRWLGLPVEYQDDPLGVKFAPEAFISYTDWEGTIQANKTIDAYEKAGERKFGRPPTPASAFVAYMIACSGFLGVGNRRISAFNIPNDDAAEKVVIYLFPDRIGKKNETSLAPAMKKLTGIESSNEDAEAFVFSHEEGHGWRFNKEAERNGPLKPNIREGLANRRALILAAESNLSPDHIGRVVKGYLAYGADDLIGDKQTGEWFRKILSEPYGRNQPTLEQILQGNPYRLDAYFTYRAAYLKGLVRPDGYIDIDGLIRLAEEYEPIYAELARSGDEQTARETFNDLIDRRRVFSVPDLFRDLADWMRINPFSI